MADLIQTANLPLDPTQDQTEETIRAFLVGCSVGDDVAILTTHDSTVAILLTTVTDVDISGRKLYTGGRAEYGNNAWHQRSGKNCLDPRGKSRLIEPTPGVRDFVLHYPIGSKVSRDFDLHSRKS